MLSKSILMAKTMRKKHFKTQMLVGNSLNSYFHTNSKDNMPLEFSLTSVTKVSHNSIRVFRIKGGVSWDPEWRHDFNVFPTKIWIFKFFFLMVFAIKMLLDNIYGLPNHFEFKSNHFNSLSFKQNINLKIQILAGNTLKSCLHSGSQEKPPLISPWASHLHYFNPGWIHG